MTNKSTAGATHGGRPPSSPLRHSSFVIRHSPGGMGMQIAQIAPLAERVPPELYGGTERVVSALTEELVRRGHQVTLFASGDSRTGAELVPITARALRLDPKVLDHNAYTMLQLGTVFDRAGDFDIIHNHLDYYALPF